MQGNLRVSKGVLKVLNAPILKGRSLCVVGEVADVEVFFESGQVVVGRLQARRWIHKLERGGESRVRALYMLRVDSKSRRHVIAAGREEPS